jgi:hypothetical protein
MRIISYAVTNTDTHERHTVGVSHEKAEKLLAEMQSRDPKGNYIITYRWGNI